MKVLDTGNAPQRLKVFLLWGVVLLIVQIVGKSLALPNTNGNLVVIIFTLLFTGFAGYMTAGALKNNTGDKRPSTIYGALPPIFAEILGWVVALLMGTSINFELPLLPMVAGIIG